jgi:hypothetical protein
MMNGHGGQEEYEEDDTAALDRAPEKEREDKSQGQGTPGQTDSPLDTPTQVSLYSMLIFGFVNFPLLVGAGPECSY